MTINTNAVFAVFDDVDNSSTSFTERLLALGIASAAEARPLAMQWAAKKYGVAITKGQRGDTLPRGSDAQRAMYRVLEVCFPKADKPAKVGKGRGKADPVEALLAKFKALTPAQKRAFKAAI